MMHARPDYNRIQDPAGKIPADEPVFLLRGRDPCAYHAVRMWAHIAGEYGVDPEMIRMANEQADRMELWADAEAAKHGLRPPDVSHER